jgi:hypothetical protein
MYGLVNMTNSMLWVSFSPISNLTEDFFDHEGGLTSVVSQDCRNSFLPHRLTQSKLRTCSLLYSVFSIYQVPF